MKKTFSFSVSAMLVLCMIAEMRTSVQAQWVEANGPYSSTIYGFASVGSTLFAGWQKGVYISTDNGANWTTYTNSLTNNNVTCLAGSSDGKGGTNVFASTGYFGPYLSTDNGKTWIQRFIGGNYNVASLAALGSKIFAGTNSGAFVSSDNGMNWDTVSIALPANYRPTCLTVDGKVFIVSQRGLIVSTDTGATWTIVNSGMTQLVGMTASGSDLFAGADSVLRSTDGGASWTNNSNGLGITAYNRIGALAASGNNIFAGTSSKGMFLSTDNGANWAPISSGLPNNGVPNNLSYTQVYSLAVTDSFVLAGFNQGGIWRRPLSQMTASVDQHITDDARGALLLYPNPVSGNSIHLDGLDPYADIHIFDAMGREVRTERITDSRTGIDLTGLASGVYSVALVRQDGLTKQERFTIAH